jgi:hypothetical protein
MGQKATSPIHQALVRSTPETVHLGFALRQQRRGLFALVVGLPKVTMLANRSISATSPTFAATMDPCYLNNAIASSASTPPVIEIGANGALAATSALDSMI